MPTKRKLYNRCFQAWREYKTYLVHDIWELDVQVYRAAGKSFVDKADVFSGWKNYERHMQFIRRKLELMGW